jgi:hypothetical protein
VIYKVKTICLSVVNLLAHPVRSGYKKNGKERIAKTHLKTNDRKESVLAGDFPRFFVNVIAIVINVKIWNFVNNRRVKFGGKR